MRIFRYISLFLIALPLAGLHAQSPLFSLGAWHMKMVSGELDVKGQYRTLESNFNDISEDQQSTYLLSGLKLNTTSYIWDEDILLLNLNGEYSPELRDEKYITVPDRSEVRTLKKIDLMATIFNNKPVTISGFFNFDQNYFNRELLTNVKSNNRQWGGNLSLNNKVLPVTISYRNVQWDQEELQTGRIFDMQRENVQARATKSFGTRDRHELIYAHNNYLYNYAGLNQTSNIIDRAALNNNIFFDAARKYNFNSRITYYQQKGTSNFDRFEAIESLSFDLPHDFRLNANLDLYKMRDAMQEWDQITGRTSLRHKLFLSLTTRVYFEYGKVKQEALSLYNQSDIRGGVNLRYTKKIPTGGYLNLSYRYYRHHHETDGVSGFLQVLNEEQSLSDGEITLLSKPYIEIGSVLVKDVSGAIIYQQNFDYILIERNSYIEIQRVPGGQIPNGAAVYIDYTYEVPGSYEYDANNNQFGASILLFRKFVEFYYRFSIQDYPRIVSGDFLTLNYFTQHVYGARLDFGIARAGVEFDNYESNIIPYKMRRYYVDVNWNIRSKLLISINGNIRDYRMIADDVNHLYSNVSGRVAYKFRPRTTLSIESGYLNQRGINIDLDLLTARAELLSIVGKLQMRVGVEMYRRIYLESDFAFNGAYIGLTRKF